MALRRVGKHRRPRPPRSSLNASLGTSLVPSPTTLGTGRARHLPTALAVAALTTAAAGALTAAPASAGRQAGAGEQAGARRPGIAAAGRAGEATGAARGRAFGVYPAAASPAGGRAAAPGSTAATAPPATPGTGRTSSRASVVSTPDPAAAEDGGPAIATAAGERAAALLVARVHAQQLEVAQQQAQSRVLLAERSQALVRAARERAERLAPTWVLPTSGYRLTAGFHDASGLWSSGRHTGLDFATGSGTPVVAIGAGVVVSASWDGAYGNKIVVRHDDGTVSWYAHLSAYVVRSGHVSAGEVIGRVGSTGNTTGPHLHLEIHPGGGDAVDPKAWLVARDLSP